MTPMPVGIVASARVAGSSWTPASIAGLDLWLDADALTLADGDPVATWDDLSSANNDATQSSASLRPTYRATGGPSSLPAVDFDFGLAHHLVAATSASGAGQTVLAAVRITSLASYSTLFASSSSGGIQCRVNTDGTLTINKAGVAGIIAGGDAVTAATWCVVAFVWDDAANTARVRLNDNAEDTATSTVNLATGLTSTVGRNFSGEYLNGDLLEILHYGAALSVSDVSTVIDYLQTKWGI